MIKAIKKTQGPCIVLAGAGTGKTHTIVEKIKYLIEKKIYPPEKIVCITFSNEATNSLFSRIKKLLPDTQEPIIRTFHSFSADLLRQFGDKINVKKNFTIITPDDAKITLHKYFSTLPSNCHKYIETIGTAKDLGISIEEIEKFIEKKLNSKGITQDEIENELHKIHLELQKLNSESEKDKRKQFIELLKEFTNLKELKKFIFSWKAYEKIKIRNNYQDYSDLNKNSLKLLKKHPEISDEFSYIIVDEFQDTNKLQLDFLFEFAKNKNITIVGDLNQSIYRFRGAYKENFNAFKKYFNVQPSEIFNLDKSYRSSNKILSVAHKLILNNYEDKNDCFKIYNIENKDGEKVEIYELKNRKEEARKVVELIEKEIEQGKKYEEICVMFRTHQQGRIIKNYFEQNKIPFSSVTKKPLLKQKDVKIAVDFLKILFYLRENKKGGEQFWWDLIYQSNLNKNDLILIGKFIRQNQKNHCLSNELLNNIEKINLSVQGKILVKSLVGKIKFLLSHVDKSVYELLQKIYSVNEEEVNEKQKILDFNKLCDLALNQTSMHYGELASFVHYLEILESLNINIGAPEIENHGVKLMTSHSTKGLEFDTVIITNLSQGRFPIERISKNNLLPSEIHPELKGIENLPEENLEQEVKNYKKFHQILEERRLCYVSFTRAKEKLILTYAKEYGGKKSPPSQFLTEINFQSNKNIDFFVDNNEKYKEQEKTKSSQRFSGINFEDEKFNLELNKKIRTLSPSALLLFKKCQKKFEYKYLYNMPEPKPVAWEEIRLGSFVHLILEKGVKRNFGSEKEFINLAKEIHRQEDWREVNLDEAIFLLQIFYQRNKNKFDIDSQTEKILKMKIEGINFVGFADRIDFTSKGLEIIDYKTGKSKIPPLNRNWQLGYYALAASKMGKVNKITLEMLRLDKPLEFELGDDKIARCISSDKIWFDLNQIEQELTETAKQIKKAYENGFKPCPPDKNCKFCDEWVYGN